MSKPYEELYLLAKHLAKETQLAPLMGMILQGSAGLVGASQACLVLFDDLGMARKTAFWGIAVTGEADYEAWNLWVQSGMAGLVYHTQRIVHLPNIQVDPRWGAPRTPHFLPTTGATLGIPLIHGNKPVAVMLLLHGQTGYFDAHHLPIAEEIASLCAGHLKKAMLLEYPQKSDDTALAERLQLHRDLSAMIYHDLRVPLQTIRASSTRLAEILANHPEMSVLNLLQVNIRSVRQLRRLVDNLLDMERLENGDAFIQHKPAYIRDIITEAIELVQPLAVEASQHFRFAIADDLPQIYVDSDVILRVVINLVENALKYTPSGGVIIIGAQVRDALIWVNVQDSGEGIPKHLQEKIFEKFSRAHQETSHKSIGLGLTFCRMAIEAHGGKIWVESEAGEGANFIFTLPLSAVSTNNKVSSQVVIA